MSKLGNAKIMGGIGAILTLIGGAAFGLLGIVGLILLFIAVKYISEETKDKDIFKNYLYSFIFALIAIIAFTVIMLVAVGAMGGFDTFTKLSEEEFTDFDSFMDEFGVMVGGCIAAFVVGWILYIISAIYLRRSYDSIAKHTKVNLFRTTGLVYFIGALTFIIGIGIIIILIARILEIVSYFSLPDNINPSTEPTASYPKTPEK